MRSFLLLTLLFIAASAHAEPAAKRETAIFAGGCFWSMEAVFDDVPGVISATSGYTGGTVANPSYEQVSEGNTGHVEAVQVIYDPARITYEKLLSLFWHNVDMFNAKGQFCDYGPEYRSEIFTTGEAQMKAAGASQAAIDTLLGKKTVTRIVPASPFYAAEPYHQKYKHDNPIAYASYRLGCGRDTQLDALWRGHEE